MDLLELAPSAAKGGSMQLSFPRRGEGAVAYRAFRGPVDELHAHMHCGIDEAVLLCQSCHEWRPVNPAAKQNIDSHPPDPWRKDRRQSEILARGLLVTISK